MKETTIRILNMLTRAVNVDEGIESVLAFLGKTWKISRAYIFETTEDLEYVNNTYEWCAEGIAPQIDRLQHLSIKEYGYDQFFIESDMFYCPNIAPLPKQTREILEEQDIKAMTQCAIRERGMFRGFIGIDDCCREREDWRPGSAESLSLRYVSGLLSMYLLKERHLQQLDRAHEEEIRLEAAQNARLAAERSQYRNALTKNAIYTIHFDVTDGYINEEIVDRNGFSWMLDAGLSVPCTYDEQAARFIDYYGVEFEDAGTRETFSQAGLLKMYETGRTSGSFEYYQKNTDAYSRIQILLGKNEENGHILATLIAFDVTRIKKENLARQRALKEALIQAEHANRAKTTFLNNMSHDIRTPMNAIIGFTALASTHVDDREKVIDYLKKIQTSSNHLLSLINDVLDMSRIESGKVKIEETEISLPEVMQDIKNIVQADTHAKQLELFFDTEDVVDGNVWCDRLRLNQILLNCLSNAIKFTPAGGTIGVKVIQLPCRREGFASYEFKIRDTGIGMSREFIEHIFEPFERERSSTVSGIQGTGLGMSITKNIVDMMGGHISVTSEQGKGSEFTVALTLRLTTAPERSGQEKPADLEGLSILLVEDNVMNREIAEEILTELGARVLTAQNGSAAINVLKNAAPDEYDVVLMDIQMPVMDGFEATRQIRAFQTDYAKIPVIAMTANAFEEDRRAALKCGMDGYIAKPINIKSIVKTIREILHLYGA